ncbi:MAG TPA: hypothetical protein EYP19_11730 [Desulfobacterales bacterium]|nr:hypothetical protein [Desulfobacterales bacterium]
MSIYRETTTWQGDADTTLVGSYDVWNEEGYTVNVVGVDKKEKYKGVIFLFSDIDLTDCYITLNGKRYDIVASDRFVDERQDFHHIEFTYR